MRRRRWRTAAIIGVVVALAGGGAALASAIVTPHHAVSRPTEAVHTPSLRYLVAPDGQGDCVVAACRTINAAVARAKADHAAGALIELAAGSYGAETIDETKHPPALASNLVVQPAPGASVVIRAITLNASNITLRNLTFNGSVKLGTTAVSSGLDGVTTHGGGVYLGASRSFIRNSSITPTVDADGVQVKAYGGKNPDGVSIEHTTIGPTYRGPKRGHVDCIQVLGGSNIVIRYNRLFHCADQGIIASSGASGRVLGPIDVERNEVQLCPQRGYDCDGHDAINMKAPRVVFVHNTVIDGGTRFNVPDLTLAANYIQNLKSCDGTIESNLITSTHCAGLSSSNRRGELDFVDANASPPNLTPRSAVAVPAGNKWVGGEFSVVDIDGRKVDPGAATVGAVQLVAGG